MTVESICSMKRATARIRGTMRFIGESLDGLLEEAWRARAV
jgi:hypothetical protein